MGHLRQEQIDRYVEGLLSSTDIETLHEHVADCPDCRMTLEQASGKRFESPSLNAPLHEAQSAAPEGSGAKWLWMAGAITAVILIAVAWQYIPRKRAVSAASLNDSGVAIELDSNGVAQGLNDASGIEREQASAVLRDRGFASGRAAAFESPETAYRIRQLRASPHPSHLLMAVIFAREGLYRDAEVELQTLVKENPESALAKSLLQSVEKTLSAQNAGRK